MRKILLILLIMVLNVGFSYAACGGAGSYNGVEGQNVLLTAPNGPDDAQAITWTIVNPSNYPSDHANYPAFSGASGCNVNFNVVNADTYTVQATNAGGTSQMTVVIADSVTTTGFGHQCYSVETGNCGDIEVFGDVVVSGLVSADNVFAFSWMHSFGDLTIGNFVSPAVILSVTGVTLPDTTITGSLSASGAVSAASASVAGDVSANKFIGPIDLTSCANPPKIYAEGNDIVVEIGSC